MIGHLVQFLKRDAREGGPPLAENLYIFSR